jgi:hypothetical protein
MPPKNPSWYSIYTAHALPETQFLQDDIRRLKHAHHAVQETISRKDLEIQKLNAILSHPKTIEKEKMLTTIRHEIQKLILDHDELETTMRSESHIRVAILKRIHDRLKHVLGNIQTKVKSAFETVEKEESKPLHFEKESDDLFYDFYLEDAKNAALLHIGSRDDSAGQLILSSEKAFYEDVLKNSKSTEYIENQDEILKKHEAILKIDETIAEELKKQDYLKYKLMFLHTCIKGEREQFCSELKKILQKLNQIQKSNLFKEEE